MLDLIRPFTTGRHAAIGVMLTIVLLAGSTLAYDIRTEDDIYLTGNFDQDLLLFGNDISFDGYVEGDILSAGRTLTIDGQIDGNLWLAGERVTISGAVNRSVRTAGQYVTLNANVEGDVIAFAQEVYISNQTELGRDCAAFGAEVIIDGVVDGNCHLRGGVVRISGRVLGNINAAGDRIILTPQAVVEGDFYYESHEKADIAPEAQILGSLKWKRLRESEGADIRLPSVPPPTGWVWRFLFLCGSLLIGTIVILFKHDMTERIIADIKSNFILHGLVGLLVIVATPVVAILTAITIIGLPAAAAAMSVYFLFFIIAKIFVGIMLGHLLLGLLSQGRRVSLGWSMVLGLVVLALLFTIPVLGWILYLLAWAIGAGALTVCFFRRKQVVVQSAHIST
jgi:cytoskeletal protein CcmA (bactofilin family)